MAGENRTCTNCGNQQASGAFCERCGTRLPELQAAQPAVEAPPAAPPAPEPTPAPVAPPAAPPASAAPVASQQPSAPPYPYAAQPQPAVPRVPGPFSKLFDLSFQGFVTRDSLRLLFMATLILLGVYWVFALIFGILAAVKLQGYWCIGIFSSLVLVTIMIIWTRILMELTMTVTEMKADTEKAASAAAEAAEAAKKAAPKAETKPAAKAASKAAPKTTKVATTAKTTKAAAAKTSK